MKAFVPSHWMKVLGTLALAVIPLVATAEPVVDKSQADRGRVDSVTADGPNITLSERLDALYALSPKISIEQSQRLFTFLRSTKIPQGLETQHVWALKNDLLNTLREQNEPSPEYEQVLRDILNNPAQDSVMRDYALQHARPWYPLSANKAHVLALLWGSARGKDGSLPGTAMLSLFGIWQEYPSDVSPVELGALALQVAKDETSHIDARISCLQICGKIGYEPALSYAIQTAQKGKVTQFRMSAIATIGDIGDKKQTPLLNKLAKDSDPGLVKSATAAIKRIGKRS